MRSSGIAVIGAVLAAWPGASGLATAPPGDAGRVAVELEAIENDHDGCTACGCRGKGEIDPGAERDWWVAYGIVGPSPGPGWEALSSSSRCGDGSFRQVSQDFRRTIGAPYAILDLTAAAAPDRRVLSASLSLQTFVRFDPQGKAIYKRTTQKRDLAPDGDLIVPMLVAGPLEEKSFGVYEVLLHLRARPLARVPAVYGTVAVSSDVPGALIALDGGLVGRMGTGEPAFLKNVPAGTRVIRVRDYSGREARQDVIVRQDETSRVDLRLLPPPGERAPDALVPLSRNPQGQEEFWRPRDGALVVKIPAGEFRMGSDAVAADADQHPSHQVFVSEFLLDKTEVTWRQYRKFLQAQGAPLPEPPIWGAIDDYPATTILWSEASAFCGWVGGRLPTEAEWEKGARGADGRLFPWGDTWEPGRCNSIDGGPHRPESVGSFPGCVSPYGALEMNGGVWEWCSDWYGANYYSMSPSRDPKGPASGSVRALRGASWINPYQQLTAPARFMSDPSWRNPNYGFRCAQDPPR